MHVCIYVSVSNVACVFCSWPSIERAKVVFAVETAAVCLDR